MLKLATMIKPFLKTIKTEAYEHSHLPRYRVN